MSADYEETLDGVLGAVLYVEFTTEGRHVVDYRVVLLLVAGASVQTIRVHDSAHGFNEMHRYTRDSGKQTGVRFHRGTLGEGMRAAIVSVKDNYREMIEGWEAT